MTATRGWRDGHLVETSSLASRHERVVRELGRLIRRSRASSAAIAAEVHPSLTASAYSFLVELDRGGPQRAGDLIALFGLDKSTVSRHLAALEALHLVERLPDPEDGRASILSVSQEGAQRLADAAARRRGRLDTVFQDWSEGDLDDFGRLLELYNESIGAPAAQARVMR